MKSILILAIALLTSSYGFCGDTLSSKINKATVFLSGAQVFRQTSTVPVKKGVNEVVIKDVSPYITQQQLQATAVGNFLILDVQLQTQYVPPSNSQAVIVPAKTQREMTRLEDSILFLTFELERINEKLNNLASEKSMIMQSQLIKSGGTSDTLPEFKEIVTFYRAKLDDINELVVAWKKKKHKAGIRDAKHKVRLQELRTYVQKSKQPNEPAKTRYHIVVTTYSDFATSGKIKVNYFINNAGWIPAYDLRANSTTEPINITYKAHVFQNSGEDWDNVKLILSTYDRTFSAVKPTAGVWRLDYTINKPKPRPISTITRGDVTNEISNEMYYSQNMSSPVEAMSAQREMQSNSKYKNVSLTYVPGQSLSNINQNFSNVEFEVRLPYSIKADGSQKLMVVMNQKVDAKFYHYMLPRMNKYGFLQAKIGDWENLSLLPGKANIYFKQTIVGSTMLDPSAMSDTMELTLGRDQGIVSTRKKISEEERKVGLSKRILKEYTFEIEVRNNTRSAVDLTLEDLIPVTKNEDIKIKMVNGNGAYLNDTNGMLTWKLKMKAGEKQIIRFTYSIEHEKNKPVS
ncbi:MAG: DUF4139 domain-containing protein [Crocinitomicaceae bacterium]|nr:DUF4139 domain-containing protein [Flavobacteriales bacterium]NQZ34725.1 DUF4139 domain-containing protein [Crocinitomicaceae bacterium]